MAIDPLPFLESLLTQPRSATVDGLTVDARSADEIKTLLELYGKVNGNGGAARSPGRGAYFTKLVPPSTVE